MLSLGKASVERNLCCSVLADKEIFRRKGGGCVAELPSGIVLVLVLLSSCVGSSAGLAAPNGLRAALSLFAKELLVLGLVRCDRRDTLLLTLEPRSVTLLVRLNRLLSRRCEPSFPGRVLLLLPLLVPLYTASEVATSEVEVLAISSWTFVGCAIRFPVSLSRKDIPRPDPAWDSRTGRGIIQIVKPLEHDREEGKAGSLGGMQP